MNTKMTFRKQSSNRKPQNSTVKAWIWKVRYNNPILYGHVNVDLEEYREIIE